MVGRRLGRRRGWRGGWRSPSCWPSRRSAAETVAGGAVGQLAVNVGELPAVAGGQVDQLRPAFAGAHDQPVAQGPLGRLRRRGHGIHDVEPLARRGVAGMTRVGGEKRSMPGSSPDQIVLCDGQRRLLAARARRVSGEHRDVLRARIVLGAAGGTSNAAIARNLGITEDTVRKWRGRFCRHGLDGLRDRPRSGRPRRFAATVVAEVKALACELPVDSNKPLARWSCPELALEAARRGIVAAVSASTVRRWLRADAIKPVAASIVDLPARSGFRVQGSAGARPLRPHLGRQTTRCARLGDQRG